MIGYVFTKQKITGEIIKVTPTGKKDGEQAEFLCLSPGSNCERIWLRREEIFGEEHID